MTLCPICKWDATRFGCGKQAFHGPLDIVGEHWICKCPPNKMPYQLQLPGTLDEALKPSEGKL
jgi:hypothetical protein